MGSLRHTLERKDGESLQPAVIQEEELGGSSFRHGRVGTVSIHGAKIVEGDVVLVSEGMCVGWPQG